MPRFPMLLLSAALLAAGAHAAPSVYPTGAGQQGDVCHPC
ncbi:hypothetical protein, partial [Pseudomonas aeruginosa]